MEKELKEHRCELCGRPGKKVIDPYQSDIDDIEVEMVLYDDCIQGRSDDT